MADKRNYGNQPKKRVMLVLTDPVDGTFTATATVSEEGQPMDNTGIIFMVNGKPNGSVETTDDNGIAVKSITLDKGSYTISATIEGTSYASSKNLTIKGPEKKVPADLKVTVSGSSGEFIISVQVLDSGKSGIKKAIIQIIDPNEPFEDAVKDVETDDNGSHTFVKKFADRDRILTILAKGTPLRWKRTLWGPANNERRN